ncbi:MAG: hypothetical protein IJT96_02990 [Lachnospiraceae bacterium]|nr:hypothetical protein [Lachnospiraceae bacterium]
MNINAVCEKREQAEALTSIHGINRIFRPGNILPYVFRNGDAQSLCSKSDKGDYLSQPFLLVRNLDEIGFLREQGYDGEIYADHTLYTYNKASREMLNSLGVSADTAPLELTYRELKERSTEGSELMIYGRVPMMISAGCVYRNSHNDKCVKDIERGQDIVLKDRTDTDFPVLCVCRYCYNIILNSVPLSLHGEMDRVREIKPASVRLYFTTENGKETAEIAKYFIALVNGDTCAQAPPYDAFTKGHFIKRTE